MATKDFSKMTTKKLNALMNSASEEDKKAIQEELTARAQLAGKAEGQVYENEEPLAPAEEEALKRAEAEAEAKDNGELAEKPAKMTAEELHALAEEYKTKYVGHKCQVVPFNTIEWVDGYIAGVIEEKRSMKLLLAIKTADGKRIVKVHDSKLLKISDEIAEKPKATRTRVVKEKAEEWTPEQIAEQIAPLYENVGKPVIVKEGDEEIEGRIVGIVTEKRGQTFMYRIEYAATNEDGSTATKVMHKVYTNEALTLQDFDEKGTEFHEKFMARKQQVVAPKTPAEKLASLKADVETAERNVKTWMERLETRKAALEAFVKENPDVELPVEGETPEEAPATEEAAGESEELA